MLEEGKEQRVICVEVDWIAAVFASEIVAVAVG